MAVTLTDWLRNLRGRLPASDTVPDAELLHRFAATRDEDAFSALVARHGPMVFGVCRRVLGHSPDAEDAFQAAFVVLAVKADAVVRLGKVGAWLHGVAFHVARKARDRSARDRVTSLAGLPVEESRLPARPEPTADPDAEHLREKLDEVLAGLPEKYRACVVLCDLEGLARKDAADRLGWTEGTLSGRLARARKLLADRLARRGVTVGSAGLAAVLSAQPLAAAVPPSLAASTLAAVALVGGGIAALPPGLAALTLGVTRAMFPSRIKFVAAGLVGAGLLSAGLGSYLAAASADPQTPTPPPPAKAAPADTRPQPAPAWKEKAAFKHEDAITGLALGPNEAFAADAKGMLIAWSLRGDGKETVVFRNLNASVECLAHDPDANWLFFFSGDRQQITGVNLVKRVGPGIGLPGSKFLGFSPDTKLFFYTDPGDDKSVTVMPNQMPMNLFGGFATAHLKHDAGILHAAISADKTAAATATADDGVHAWSLATQKKLWSRKVDKLEPTAVAVSPDGKRVAVAGKGGSVRLYDGDTGKETATLTGHTGAVNVVAFNGEDGKRLATAGDDGCVRVWDPATGKSVAVLKGHTGPVKAVALSPDGSVIVSGSADKSVKVWEKN